MHFLVVYSFYKTVMSVRVSKERDISSLVKKFCALNEGGAPGIQLYLLLLFC
jgi:hypothetical protein